MLWFVTLTIATQYPSLPPKERGIAGRGRFHRADCPRLETNERRVGGSKSQAPQGCPRLRSVPCVNMAVVVVERPH
jgi:hypothetical protein